MKRVLFIGSGNPWSGGAGYLVRQNLFLRALSEVADLTLAMLDANPAAPPPFPAKFIPIELPRRTRLSKPRAMFDDLFGNSPRMIRGYDVAPSRAAVAKLDPAGFDAVFAYRIDFAYYAGVLDHKNLILDIDDPEHIRWQRRIRAISGNDGDFRTRRDLVKLRDFETAAVGRAKLSFVCQNNDSNGWPIAPQVVPNSIDLIENPRREVKSPRILFVGNCAGSAQSPNVDAVIYFLTDIWPIILKDIPDAEFQLVGATGEAVQSAAAKSRNVTLSGFVDHLADAYAAAAISVAPIRFGTGTRIKILEAFAYACPVVSTLAGAEGIEAIPGQEIELATNPGDFARWCVELLNNPQHRERIGQGGHALAARAFNSHLQNQRLVGMLSDFLDGRTIPPNTVLTQKNSGISP